VNTGSFRTYWDKGINNYDLLLEALLFAGTALAGLVVLIPEDITAILFMLWLVALTICQALHSLLLALMCWNKKDIRTGLIIYWILAGINLIVLAGDLMITLTTLLITPLLIATYMWVFTLRYWLKARSNKS
jgi:hypothetical protein